MLFTTSGIATQHKTKQTDENETEDQKRENHDDDDEDAGRADVDGGGVGSVYGDGLPKWNQSQSDMIFVKTFTLA